MSIINLKSATSSDLDIIAENWYGRLNRLKAWIADNPSDKRRGKAADLAAEMVLRMLSVANVYTRVKTIKEAARLSKYQSGGVPVRAVPEGTVEVIELPNGNKFIAVDSIKGQKPNLN
jgi:hypothetical protein